MKINEPLNLTPDPEFTPDPTCVDSEAITRMKEEFHAFVNQTRQRLNFLSEAIEALDREEVDSRSDDLPVDTQSTISTEPTADKPIVDVPRPEAVPATVRSEPVQETTSVPAEPTPAETAATTQVTKPANDDPADTAPSSNTQSATATSSDSQPPAPAETIERPANGQPVDPGTDPFEHLNAIKQRLARQIENS